jgi:hypothetical protein
MKLNDDNETVAAMDILVPKIGELIGGSQRYHTYILILSCLHAMRDEIRTIAVRSFYLASCIITSLTIISITVHIYYNYPYLL